jgi:hypothetical protein
MFGPELPPIRGFRFMPQALCETNGAFLRTFNWSEVTCKRCRARLSKRKRG